MLSFIDDNYKLWYKELRSVNIFITRINYINYNIVKHYGHVKFRLRYFLLKTRKLNFISFVTVLFGNYELILNGKRSAIATG